MIYFTSDLHLAHQNIIEYANRPFSNTDEMDRILISNINETVGKDDTLYILGDIQFGYGKFMRFYETRKSIICKDLRLILGNHDPREVYAWMDAGFSKVGDYDEVKIGKRRIAACSHYPMMTWNHRNKGSIMLHGHIHAGRDYNIENRDNGIFRYDVGVDANGYRPVSLDEIVAFFNGRKPKTDIAIAVV